MSDPDPLVRGTVPYGSEDPDPYQNVKDPVLIPYLIRHLLLGSSFYHLRYGTSLVLNNSIYTVLPSKLFFNFSVCLKDFSAFGAKGF